MRTNPRPLRRFLRTVRQSLAEGASQATDATRSVPALRDYPFPTRR